MARPRCLMRDFTNLNRIYKAHWTNVWWTMKVFHEHCQGSTRTSVNSNDLSDWFGIRHIVLDTLIKWVCFSDYNYYLSHLPLDKMTAISQMIYSDASSWMKSLVFWLKFHWSLFLRVYLTITQHWLGIGDKSLSEPMLQPDSLTHICSTKGRWVNALRPQQNGWNFTDSIFSWIFLNEAYCDWIQISQHWFRSKIKQLGFWK